MANRFPVEELREQCRNW